MKHILNRKLYVYIIVFVISIIMLFASYRIFRKSEYPIKYSEYVEKYSKEYGVDKYLVYAVMRSESSFREDSVSSVGAKGLMQITDDTYFWLMDKNKDTSIKDVNNLFIPEINIKYGVYFLYVLQNEFKDLKSILAAYHAGRGNLQKWLNNPQYSSDGKTIDIIPFKDTNYYANKTMKTYDMYKKIYEG